MELIIPLTGLKCQRCVAKLQAALDSDTTLPATSVEKTALSVTSSVDIQTLIDSIRQQGFDVAMREYQLSGLNCGRCVNRVKTALSERDDVVFTDVTKTQLSLFGEISEADLSKVIADLGYQLSPADSAEPEHTAETDTANATPTNTTPSDTEQAASAPRTATTPQTSAQTLMISGMTCASCVASVEKTILQQTGVSYASVSLAEHSADVVADDLAPVIAALTEAGYPATRLESEESRRSLLDDQTERLYRGHIRDTWIGLAVGIPMMAIGMIGNTMMITSPERQWGWGVGGLITLIVLMTAGAGFFRNSWSALQHRRATMDTLVALGTGSAWLYSMAVVLAPDWFPMQARHVYFEASAMIIGLISLGHAIEVKAKRRSSQAIEKLMDLQPQTARLLTEQGEQEVAVASVQREQIIRVKPGEKIPLDGEVIRGESYVDEALLTGEPLPNAKTLGDTVHSGTFNQQGTLDIKVTAVSQDSLLTAIIQLVRKAQNSKPALARMVDKVAAVFVPVVVAIAILTAIIWGIFGPAPSVSYMLVTSVTVLIIACPCALGLATPMSVTNGVGKAAELGILVRDADALQLASEIDTVVLDKTGTLTQGSPSLVLKHFFNEAQSEQAVLDAVASIELFSEHPLAKPLVDAGKADETRVANPTAVTGQGMTATLDDQPWAIGNARLMTEQGIDIEGAQSHVAEYSSQGATPIYVACQGQLVALLGISDPLRDTSIKAVAAFHAMGKHVIMLTGDHPQTAEAIAKQAGIDEVIAGVLPDGKSAVIEQLTAQGKRVLMVGDGINDAPALAAAHASIAIGTGSDIAKESAHFILVRPTLLAAVDCLALSDATLRNMRQNLFGAFIYNTIGIPVAAGILFPFTGHLLDPMVAGAAMAASSITVVSNASRLKHFKSVTTND
uniref:heavy metal translocating P-type ATPase n=1 Tax=Thaumasiovibrio occultus TaxID=1891184 RepID=UPI000B34C90F|nr:heavy metal translocating P-type ATPase [Thaumasiovibrio occultus]